VSYFKEGMYEHRFSLDLLLLGRLDYGNLGRKKGIGEVEGHSIIAGEDSVLLFCWQFVDPASLLVASESA
jgi:hypothetical protein